MKIVVTGGTGLLGRNLARRLEGEHDLVSLSRNPPDRDDQPWVRGDVLDRSSLDAAMVGCEVLVHAAGLVSHEQRDAGKCWDLHVVGTANALDAAEAAGVRRVIYVSTSGTVAVSRDPVVLDEKAPVPLGLVQGWPYYRSKLFAEQDALRRNKPGFEVVSLNPTLLLGPGDLRAESARCVLLFLQGRLAACPPGGLSFVDVRDVADAVAAALTQGKAGERYLLGAVNWSWTEFYAALARLTDMKPPGFTLPRKTLDTLKYLPDFARDQWARVVPISKAELELACHYWYLDAGKARRELGFRPRDPDATLAETVRGVG